MSTKNNIREPNYEILVTEMAKRIVIKGENTKEFAEYATKTLQDLGPQTEVENNLCEKYIFLHWKLRRLYEHERNILSEQNSRLDNKDETEIYFGKKSGRRVRNIKRIDLCDSKVVYLTQQQHEIEKRMKKMLEQFRAEQRKRMN